MATTVEIMFVGLCSFLNMKNATDPNLPAPSVIVHRVPGGHGADMQHTAYIAFDRTKMKVTGATAKQVTNSNFSFIPLDGQKLTLIDADMTATPKIDATFDTDVARFSQYAKLPNPAFKPDR